MPPLITGTCKIVEAINWEMACIYVFYLVKKSFSKTFMAHPMEYSHAKVFFMISTLKIRADCVGV